ncbi:hypothetical protein TcCL_ESM09839 [Trypanosoma cruzi]|nr:hypothetical protein TcCL_ESM09839 [Trypanosoma cruzi]
MSLHGLAVLFPSKTEGFRRSAPTPRCIVSSRESSEDDGVHHQGNSPHLWETASHTPETGAHDVPPRQLRSLSAEGKFGEKEVSALTSTPGSFIRTTKAPSWGSTLVEGYRDALTRPRACPHNVLLLFPRRTRPHRLLIHIQEGSDGEWHLVSQQRSIP